MVTNQITMTDQSQIRETYGIDPTDIPGPLQGLAVDLDNTTGLTGDYNDGYVGFGEGGRVLIIRGRSSTMRIHTLELIRDYPGVEITTISVQDGRPWVEVRPTDR